MPPTKHKLKMKPKRYVPPCFRCTPGPCNTSAVDTLGASEPGIATVCGPCDGCGKKNVKLAFILDSGDVVCNECAREVKPCEYCGHTGVSNDPVSICVGCDEIICLECYATVPADERSCQCELV